jgi:menaquinone-dependent protoporphyrinogen oxidase
MDTAPRALVAYATAAGSTAGVAERVAAVLRTTGCAVDCRQASPAVDAAGYDAVVVGSAVHDTAWLPPALDVLRRAAASGPTPVWCFSVGGALPRGPVTRFVAAQEAARVAQDFPADLTVRDHRLFGGVIPEHGVPLWGRLFYRMIGAQPGDHRDWAGIEQWATHVGAELRQAATPAGADRTRGSARRAPRRGGVCGHGHGGGGLVGGSRIVRTERGVGPPAGAS